MPNPPLPKTLHEQALELMKKAKRENDEACKQEYLKAAEYFFKKHADSQSSTTLDDPPAKPEGTQETTNIYNPSSVIIAKERSFRKAKLEFRIGNDFNFEEFKVQIIQLLDSLMPVAKTAEHLKAIDGLILARDAAQEKSPTKIQKALKGMGQGTKWVLEKAADIGTDVAAEVIKKTYFGL